MGNKADVSSNDLLQFWDHDPETKVILLYLESFGNPRKFARLARRVGHSKPILAVKSGRSHAGTRAAASHTAALASSDVATDALFRQAGVTRVDTLAELLDTAQVLVHQPLPAGRRVAIVSNGGGPGILASDACEGARLEVPVLSAATQAELRTFVSPDASDREPDRPHRIRHRRDLRARAQDGAGRRRHRRGARHLRPAARHRLGRRRSGDRRGRAQGRARSRSLPAS